MLAASPARAATEWRRVHKTVHHSKRPARAATSGGPLYKGALLEDADSGRVLMAYNADMEWPPASMAKMMDLLVAQEQINAGRFNGNDPVRISERAAHTGGSRVGLKEGDVYPLRELMKAALVKSANDAAVAVAEKIGGSVEAMVRMMNQRAQELGMTHTEYQTVDGLPPRPTHDADRTTALEQYSLSLDQNLYARPAPAPVQPDANGSPEQQAEYTRILRTATWPGRSPTPMLPREDVAAIVNASEPRYMVAAPPIDPYPVPPGAIPEPSYTAEIDDAEVQAMMAEIAAKRAGAAPQPETEEV